MKKYDVVALGELLIDFTENAVSEQGNPMYEANPGGAPCNVLSMLNKLGHSTGFIGKVGNDSFGNMLEDTLVGAGIGTDGLCKDENVHTTLAFVHNFENGDRDFSFYRNPGADMMLEKSDVNTEMIENCKIFHYGSLSMTSECGFEATDYAIETAKKAGAVISFDPNLREPLWDSLDTAKEKISYGMTKCDILKISDNEIVWFTGKDDYDEGVKYIKEKYPDIKLILVSLGAEGSMAFSGDNKVFVNPYLQKNTIETTGAGDAFCACVLHYVVNNGLRIYDEAELKEMITFANAAASIVTTRRGALKVMPVPEEIEELLKKNKYRIDTAENVIFQKEIRDNLLAFGHRFPSPGGGSYYLGDDGTPWKERNRETWITSRMAHVYSIGTCLGHSGSEELADAALKGLLGELKDTINGGWYAGLSKDNEILPDKQCYAHAFVILAATSALIAGRPDAEKLLNEALKIYDEKFWNEEEGLSCDTWNTEFTVLDSYRGINANMHTVEAFLAVADAIDDGKYRVRAGRIIDRVIGWAECNNYRIPEHFTNTWQAELDKNIEKPDDPFKPYGATPGHGIEWSRLITQWAASTYEKGSEEYNKYVDTACKLFDRAVLDAWNSDGAPGIVYTTDWNGKPVVRDRMHWTLAEAINSSAVLFRATNNQKYAELYSEFMEYLDEKVIDHINGSWFHQLDENNNLKETVWPGKSDIYHALQSTLIPYSRIDVSIAKAVSLKS